jgi:hypothetical protein
LVKPFNLGLTFAGHIIFHENLNLASVSAFASASRSAASKRSTCDCSLVRGTADAFNLFGETSTFHPAMGTQGLGNRQSVGRSGVFDRPHVPKGPRPVLRKSGSTGSRSLQVRPAYRS